MQQPIIAKVTKRLLVVILCLAPIVCTHAQLTEKIVNSEYREIILKQLQKNVEHKESVMRLRAENYLNGLPNNRKLYDETRLSIKADIESGVKKDGKPELNYHISVGYNCHHLESTTDNYPTGKYLCEESNASMAICEITRMIVDEISPDAFKAGKETSIKISASTDASDVSHLDYGGEYGDFQYSPARYNGESVRISVSSASGINTNAQLAFLRAQGIRVHLEQLSSKLKTTTNKYTYDTRSNDGRGSQYRNVGIEITVHSAFDEEIVAMNESLVNDEFIDYNIPRVAEDSNTTTYALIIANERYPSPIPPVPYAHNDGESLAQYCIRTLGIPARQVKLMEDATIQQIKTDGINWMKDIAAATKGKAQFLIYYAGHGVTDADHNPYIMPRDINTKSLRAMRGQKEINTTARLSGTDTRKMLKQCLRIDTLCAWFNRVPVKNVVVILDACFDGNQRDGEMFLNLKHSNKKAKALRIRNDIVLLSASAFDKTAYAFEDQHHGFFTYFILRELKQTKGNIDLHDLFNSADLNMQKETSLQGKLQEAVVTPGGKLKETWVDIRLQQ